MQGPRMALSGSPFFVQNLIPRLELVGGKGCLVSCIEGRGAVAREGVWESSAPRQGPGSSGLPTAQPHLWSAGSGGYSKSPTPSFMAALLPVQASLSAHEMGRPGHTVSRAPWLSLSSRTRPQPFRTWSQLFRTVPVIRETYTEARSPSRGDPELTVLRLEQVSLEKKPTWVFWFTLPS